MENLADIEQRLRDTYRVAASRIAGPEEGVSSHEGRAWDDVGGLTIVIDRVGEHRRRVRCATFVAVALMVLAGAAAGLVAYGSGSARSGRVVSSSSASTEPRSTTRFIVPDQDFVPPTAPRAPDTPKVLPTVKDGPLSRALADKVSAVLGSGFTLKGASDVAIDCGAAIQAGFQDAEGSLISVTRQCLSTPIPLSRIAGPGARLETQPDGSVVVEYSSGYQAVVAVAKSSGELTRIEADGPPSGSPPLTPAQLRQLLAIISRD